MSQLSGALIQIMQALKGLTSYPSNRDLATKQTYQFKRLYLSTILVLVPALASCTPVETKLNDAETATANCLKQAGYKQTDLQLEKIRDTSHLLTQIKANLPRGLLCADPEKIEKLWQINLQGWRLAKGLPEPEIKKIDGKEVESPPLERYAIFWEQHAAVPKEATLIVSFGNGQGGDRESVVAIERLFEIFGKPHRDVSHYVEPTPHTQFDTTPIGSWRQRALGWNLTNTARMGLTTGRQSQFNRIYFGPEIK